MNILEQTPRESVIFEDNKVLVALAFKPLTKGHSVVIWKDGGEDINKLNTEDYEYLMDAVDVTRQSLMTFYKVEKVYLMYFDETNWVHWHLVPRYEEKGFNILQHEPSTLNEFNDAKKLSGVFSEFYNKMILED